jgi:hypothetical protein
VKVVLALLVVAVLAAAAPSEAAKIESLIQSVARLEGAKFVRNGSEYDAQAAADHLRLKLEKAGARVKTADDFIRLCASQSSMTGQPYEIHWDDGRVMTSEAFLRARLAELEGAKPPE